MTLRSLLLALLALGLASRAIASGDIDAIKQDAKAFGAQLLPGVQAGATTAPTAERLPGYQAGP